jgi:sigma-B regulation protein RsbU (phosphoserine phosphatase)
MGTLLVVHGPEMGRQYPLEVETLLGRQFDAHICLSGREVSRHHARILHRDAHYFVEDLGSSNGTFINGRRLQAHSPEKLHERDLLQIGPYQFSLRQAPTVANTESDLVVRQQLNVTTLDQSIYQQDPAQKLQAVLELSRHLARTLDLEPLLDKLLDHLMRLLPQADRAMVLLCDGDKLVVRGQRCRHAEDAGSYPYSRTIVRQALDNGAGILSEDVHKDQRFEASVTLTSLDLHSLLCVPLLGQDGQRLGVIQVDRFRRGLAFRSEDLQLLTTIAMQVSVAMENASLHAEQMREQRLLQELELAREIQQGFLPDELDGFPEADFEVLGRVYPARQVAGDLYDFFKTADGRLAFFIGDVSGKGMPAALFMVAVRTLCRHIGAAGLSPVAVLTQLNKALAADNPSSMFVTLVHGLFDPATGQVVLASAGHFPPLLRQPAGRVEELAAPGGRLLGFDDDNLHLAEAQLTLGERDMLVFYTDGVIEARNPDKVMFGSSRLRELVQRFENALSLDHCADMARVAVAKFTGLQELQDDITLLLLRRSTPARR